MKARRTQASPVVRVTQGWRPPAGDWRQTLRWAWVALDTELRSWRSAMPGLVRGEFVFTLTLWVAVFSVTAAIIAVPSIPLKTRYTAGLAAVAYLYLYAELSRLRRPVPGRRVLLTVADAAIVLTLAQLSIPYVGYAHLLVFFVAARIATRFADPRALPAGLMLLIPFDAPPSVSAFSRVFDGFAVLMVMLVVQHLQATSRVAQARLDRQTWLAGLISALARATDEDTLVSQLAAFAAPLAPGCGWVFWIKDPASDEFRAARWTGLLSGERPIVNFSPGLAADHRDAVLITGPLPGTTTGTATLLQPVMVEGEVAALVTVGAPPETFDAGMRGLIRAVAEETGVALARLQALDDQQDRRLAMEQANRLAGLAAVHAGDHAATLDALLPALTGLLRADSIHLQWVDGDQVELVVGSQDPLSSLTPESLPLAGTRTADALAQGRILREAITGRRPEDMFCVPAGLRHMAVVPLRCAGVDGTLQVARRDVRGYSTADTLVMELLAERLALLFAAGLTAAPGLAQRRVAASA